MSVTVGILGPVVVVVDGKPRDPGGRKVGRVLAALAIRAGERVPTDRLIDDVWGEQAPPSARASLQMHITKLRKLLASTPVTIETVPDGYRLSAPPGGVDVTEFIRLADDARTARADGRWQTAAERARRALDLWKSDRIEALDDAHSLAGDITGLTELRRQTRLIYYEVRLALGEHEQLVGELEEATAAEPFFERFWELLMVALYRCGRQADALAVFQRAASLLVEELGLEPSPALARIEERILLQDPSLLELPDADYDEAPLLPPPTSTLIGREDEIREATKFITEDRLVTVLGPGGVGKTTLALEVGRRLTGGFPDGALLFDLTACSRDDEVAMVAAEHLGLAIDGDALRAVTDHLRSRSMVIVIDNCEQVPNGAAELVEALKSGCPDLAIVATSRRRLPAAGRCLVLAPLAVPPDHADGPEVGGYGAVQLFIERARAVHPDLEVGPDDLPTLGRICRRVDGLPLALELVAAWTNVLTIGDIEARLEGLTESRRASDVRGRHSSLDQAIDWSYKLLVEEDRAAFSHLAVFRSAFDLAGAAAVLDVGDDEAIRMLGRLVDASLITADVGGRSARYHMLETIRTFGAEHLSTLPHAGEVTRRHRDFTVATVLNRPDEMPEASWFDRVQEMLPDLRMILDAEPDTVVEVAGRLRSFWAQRGLGHEIEPRLEAVVTSAGSASAWFTLGVMRYARGALEEARQAFEAGLGEECGAEDRARITNALGVLALESGDYEAAEKAYRQAEKLFTSARVPGGVAASRLNQGIAALNQGDLEASVGLFESARGLFRSEGDVREEAHALLRMAFAAELAGEHEVALERARAALRIVRGLGTGLALADALQYTADFEVGSGSPSESRPLLIEAVEMFHSLRHTPGLQRAMITATAVAVADEQWAEAAEVSAYAAALRHQLGIPVPAANRSAVDRLDRAIAASVPDIRRSALAERARLADVDQMVARCLDVLTVEPGHPLGVHVRTTSE